MKTKIIEGTNNFNWGKFLIGRFDHEWEVRSSIDQRMLLGGRGWSQDHLFVMDLQTGEGFVTLPGGVAEADLDRHHVWVCPMFLPFLTWLYKQDLTDIDKLPSLVELVGESSFRGYRRTGKSSGATTDPAIESALVRWFRAHDNAKDNPRKIIESNVKGAEECRRVSDECVRLMQECGIADAELWTVAQNHCNTSALPPMLQLYYDAEQDKGCPSCWLNSSATKAHPECERKIAEWFGYRDGLMAFVKSVFRLTSIDNKEQSC
jgi:hypothetical protein